MICTTVLSKIGSTLANLDEDIEKKEAEACKAYLRVAISNFAATDSSPSPPCVPIHTQPYKSNGNIKGKEIDRKMKKKVAIATPRIILSQSRNTTSSMKAISEKRLFLRLPQEYEWHKLSPAGVREVMAKKIHISPSLIGKIKLVHSSFALSPSNLEAQEEMLKAGNGLFLSGAKLEPATNWVSVLVPTVSVSIHIDQGKVETYVWLSLSAEIARGHIAPIVADVLCDQHAQAVTGYAHCTLNEGQLKTYRQAGEREHHAVLRAKAAEESTVSFEKLIVDLKNSQVSDVNDDIDEIPASSVENTTVDVIRL
ncbi:putative eka-like protein [Erysiphe necator]|uniref:Putative eka-like protein n=1 Tax=Uncinula necator TaxID=52586 RepID=A0A0B1P143_UNCNE|nr:putative eka-like protein [Erysiphe necator]